MFHAPTSETKQQSYRARTEVQPGHAPMYAQQPLAQMHSTYGNQAVLRMLSKSTPTIQSKLTVNQPGDVFEQEADRVAGQVMRMTEGQLQCPGAGGASGGRECPECSKSQETNLQRAGNGPGGGFQAPPIVHDVLRSTGQPLDLTTRAFMEPRFGYDFSQVRVHADARAAESARAVNALAYTVGDHVVFGEGEYAPAAGRGRGLIAHELTHVIQQTGRHVAPGPERRSAFQGNSIAQMRAAGPAVQRTLSIKTSGQKSPANKLTFPSKSTCSQDLGLHDCAANKFWLWSVEIEGDVPDDATLWDISQSFTGKRKGVVKTTQGKSVAFDSPLNKPDDKPDSSFLQQNSGEKTLFWIDAPGHAYKLDSDDFDSVTQVQNFTSKICSKSNAKKCDELKWFVKIVVNPGQKLDAKASKAGVGTEPTKF